LLAVIPAYHPILLSFSRWEFAVFSYFLYYALSGPASFLIGAYSATVLYSRLAAHQLISRGNGLRAVYLYSVGFLAGILIALVYWPISSIFSLRLPDWVVFIVVLAAAVSVILASSRRLASVFVFLLSGLFGVYLLASLNPVSHPLQAGVSGIFGLGVLLSSLRASSRIALKPLHDFSIPLAGIFFGVLAAILVAYFPAMSPAVAALFLHRVIRLESEDVVAATGATASASLMFSVFARKYGLVRTALAAQLPQNVQTIAPVALIASVLGVLSAFLLFPLLVRLYSHRPIRLFAAAIVVLFVLVFFGVADALALLAGAFLSLFARELGVNQSVLMGFLMVPTLLIYAPM